MFTNYFALLKIFFLQQFRLKDIVKKKDKQTSNKRKRLSSTVVTYLILLACFLPILIMMAISLYYVGTIQGRENSEVTLTVLMLVCQGLVTIFGVPAIITNVFASTDGDRVLCLPVSTTAVFLAKLSVVYINEAITSAVTILFILMPFGIGAGLGVSFYLFLILAVLLLPMLPLMVASIIAIPIAFFLRRFSNNGIVKVIMQSVMFVCFMAIYLVAIGGFYSFAGDAESGATQDTVQLITNLINNLVNNAKPVVKWFLPNWLLACAMVSTSVGAAVLNVLGSIGCNIVLLAVVMGVSILMFKSSLQGNLEHSSSRRKFAFTDKADKKVGKVNLLHTLMWTDFKRTVRNSQLGFQMLMGLFMMPLLVIIFAVVYNVDGTNSLVSTNNTVYQLVVSLVLLGYLSMLAGSTNYMGIYPISRENKSFYLLKTMPIPIKTLLFAKILLATILVVISSVLATIAAIIGFGLMWYWAIPCLIAMATYQFATMCITTYLDIRRPVLGWTVFKQSLANSRNMLFAMLISVVQMIVIAFLGILFGAFYYATAQIWIVIVMWIIILAIGGLYAWLAFRSAVRAGEKRFEMIEE